MMKTRTTRTPIVIIGIVTLLLLVGGLAGTTWYVATLNQRLPQHETQLLGQNRFEPGSQAHLRVVVQDGATDLPLEAATVRVSLSSGQPVYEGQTNALGTADVRFALPEAEGNQTLIVETESDLGTDRIERTITLDRSHKILLTTDKPLYQPGQVIHIRALALSSFDRQAAQEADLEIIIADAKGNKIFRETLQTNTYGVAATDFQLANEVNTGNFNISVSLGETSSEKSVVVEPYVLPKFDLTLNTDKSFYAPGESVNGSLNATYFFGKPVADSTVTLTGFTFDVAQQTQFELQGETDARGNFSFDFTLPDFIAGSDFEQGLGRFYLSASVIDQAASTETSSLSLPVAAQPLIVELIPEGGQLRPGLENLLYVLVGYPDGSPAQAEVTLATVREETLSGTTGAYGMLTLPYTPSEPYEFFTVTARDAQGNESVQEIVIEGNYQPGSILLRPERAVYQVGETLNATLLTAVESRTVYLDIIRDGQTVSTRAYPLAGTETPLAIDLTPDLVGTLTLNAYQIMPSGQIVRDTRLVVVDPATELTITFDADQETYRPGDSASLNLNVQDESGSGQPSAIGLAVVDEAVFALAEQDPGFAKLYFLLEEELMTPRVELHGFAVPELFAPQQQGVDIRLAAAVDTAAQATLAEATQTVNFGLQANSREENQARIADQQESYFSGLINGSVWLMAGLALGMLIISGVTVWRNQHLGKGLLVALGLIVGGLLVGWLYVMLINSVSYRLEEPIAFGTLALWLLSLLGLLIYAWRKNDGAQGWLLLLLLPIVLLGALAAFVFDMAFAEPPLTAVVILFVAAALAWILLAAHHFLEKRRLVGLLQTLASLPILGVAGAALVVSVFAAGGLSGTQQMAFNEVVMVEEMAMEADFERAAEAPTAAGDKSATAGAAPRLRQYFPETMYWLPDGETDADGTLTLNIPVADSITTWRLTALASTQNGQLGSATGSLRVFQDFFIDLTLPQALTVGDEVSIPVGLFNYLPEAQTVELTVAQENWFTLLDEPVKTLEIPANDISVVYFRIRAENFGSHAFEVTALGSQMSDAIRKPLEIFPDGRELFFSQSDRLSANQPLNTTISIPAEALAGTQQLTVKIYPGLLSQVVEGLDSLLQMPNGCFEQTSSTTYPNVLVLDYLQTTDQISPEIQLKAEEYINLGYQRLTTFEVGSSGGFSLFGDPPPDPMLTAYGLQEFHDMSQVYNVDPALIARTAEWIMSQQAGDGSWSSSDGFRESNLTQQIEKVPVTAYVLWGLADAGFVNDGRVQQGLDFLISELDNVSDGYALALAANALVAIDEARGQGLQEETTAVLSRLAAIASREGDTIFWGAENSTVMGSYGDVGSLEATALATLAFVRAGDSYPTEAQGGLNYLIQNKDSFGNWQTTQTTILALKTFIETARRASENVDATVTITLNNGQQRTLTITQENYDVVQLVQFDDVQLGDNVVDISVAGEGNLMYQVSGSYYLGWEALEQYPELLPKQLVDIDVSYDRSQLAVNEEVTVDVTVSLAEGTAEWGIVDLGIPPGFELNTDDLTALIEAANQVQTADGQPSGTIIEKFERTGRQLIVYLGELRSEEPFNFSYRLTARYPLRAQAPASSAYDYYNPGVQGEDQPLLLEVVDSSE